ncbi:DUF397 domain-containing protein [Couchioplanes azureus]|uniref:DUF397 domain-containing protein n=1 Tax=Couchioplanes caeruleus TaxID=56438 RepID=UPI001E519903|nr:DUF397 domain-containing protein [Couchioplanes caeruleus]
MALKVSSPARNEVEKRIELKQSRQQLLTRAFPTPPSVEAIISEAVLMAEPKPEVTMRRQVWHLLQATELSNVSIRILAGPVLVFPGAEWAAFIDAVRDGEFDT